MPKKAEKGINDLKTKYPELITEWDYELNAHGPENYLPGSGYKAAWKCRVCGRGWNAVISSRVTGKGCPYCAGSQVTRGLNDLQTKYAE